MKEFQRFPWLILAFLLTWRAAGAETNSSTSHYKAPSGTNLVETAKYEWKDEKRDRQVPVKIYFPKSGAGPFPVIIFSHGLGGSRDGYEYLGHHWASHGYVSVHIQHIGSDDSVWKNVPTTERMRTMKLATSKPENSINRPKDVSFVVDQLEKLNREDKPFKKRIDLNHIGMAGHSYGSFTTLAIAGQVFPTLLGGEISGVDPRVKAAIPMSSPVPRDKSKYADAFAKIHIPCFHMTGTLDDSPIGDTKASDRRVPFDNINGADQYLVTFKDGDHMIFSGRLRRQGNGEKDELFQELIKASTTAFWNAYLKNDAQSKRWLAEKGFESALGTNGKYEKKLVGKSNQP